MKYTSKSITTEKIVLANDHYVAVPYDCTQLKNLATDGVISAGTIIPSNDSSAKGVLLNNVDLEYSPNGTIVVHGFVSLDKMAVVPSDEAKTALKLVQFV